MSEAVAVAVAEAAVVPGRRKEDERRRRRRRKRRKSKRRGGRNWQLQILSEVKVVIILTECEFRTDN